MIVKREWVKKERDPVSQQMFWCRYEGWFLCGFLPLYIRPAR
jgi:hypothetical protein